MRGIVLISFLMMLIPTTSLTETATSNNLLPNAGTGQTNVQSSNSTIDGFNNSSGWTLNGITDYSTSYNELEANGTGTVSASGSLENINTTKPDGSSFTTTTDSLDGGVQLNSTTEVQNCEWTGSAYQCGQATNGQDSFSTTVKILDENNNELAKVTQNRTNDGGYNNNTFTYTDTVIYTGEGARNWEWEWTGIDGNSPNSTSPVGPNLLGAELTATLQDILYSPIPETTKNEILEIFEELTQEFEEIETFVEFKEEKMEIETFKEEEKFETVKFEEFEETTFEEEPVFEEIQFEEKKEEKFEEIKQEEEIIVASKEEEEVVEIMEEIKEEENEEKPEEIKEESNEETTNESNVSEESNTEQKEVQQKESKKEISIAKVMDKIDEKVKDIDKNLKLKNIVKIKAMANTDMIEVYNVPFYKPDIIYENQLNIQDNRLIYKKVLVDYMENDPIIVQQEKLRNLSIERQNLLNELEVLKNES